MLIVIDSAGLQLGTAASGWGFDVRHQGADTHRCRKRVGRPRRRALPPELVANILVRGSLSRRVHGKCWKVASWWLTEKMGGARV